MEGVPFCDAVTLRKLFSGRNALTVMKNLKEMEAEERMIIQEGMSILNRSVRGNLPLPNLQIKNSLFDRQKSEGTQDENL